MPRANHHRRYRNMPKLVRALREEAGLTQRGLGALLRQPQSWVHLCETGERRVDVAEFCDWAKACGVHPVDAIRRFENLG